MDGDIFNGGGKRQGQTAQVFLGNRPGTAVIASGKPQKGGGEKYPAKEYYLSHSFNHGIWRGMQRMLPQYS